MPLHTWIIVDATIEKTVNVPFQTQFEIAVVDQQAEFVFLSVGIIVSRIWVQRGPAVV